MVHIINKSSFSHSALRDCLRICDRGAAIVLIEDGVYAAAAGAEWAKILVARCEHIYALTPDIAARGLSSSIAREIQSIDYADFVQLCCEHATIQSWY